MNRHHSFFKKQNSLSIMVNKKNADNVNGLFFFLVQIKLSFNRIFIKKIYKQICLY